MWNKIKESGLTLGLTCILLLAFYSVLPEVKSKNKISSVKDTKTVEEIIAGSYTKNYTPDTTEWDTTFTSTVTPIKD